MAKISKREQDLRDAFLSTQRKLGAFQEWFTCTTRGKPVIVLEFSVYNAYSGEKTDFRLHVLEPQRCSGGVVCVEQLGEDAPTMANPEYIGDVAGRFLDSACPYFREAGRKLVQLQTEALNRAG